MSMLGRMFGFERNEGYDEGIRLFEAGRYGEAIAALRQVTRGSGRATDVLTQRLASFYVAEAHANLGVKALANGDYGTARDSLAVALEANPHYADLHLHYGRACRKSGDLPAALRAFDQALCINGRYAKAYFHRGLTLYALGQRDEAVDCITQALALDHGFEGEQTAQALAAHEAGDGEMALRLFEGVAETDVDNITRHVDMGTDLYRRALYTEAVEEFRKALALNPNYADVRNSLGIALHACGAYGEAVTQFERALAINPNYQDARVNLTLALRAAGRGEAARTEFLRGMGRPSEPDSFEPDTSEEQAA